MSIINLSLLVGRSLSPTIYDASQQLLDILLQHRFVEMSGVCGTTATSRQYVKGRNCYFRKHGQCTVNFLKDGRVHVLHGPIALWNLHDFLTNDELRVLIAFATLCEEHQELMRNYMGPRCRNYMDAIHQMPSFQVDWKNEFLLAFSKVDI
jgi:hypothetical protein